MFRDVPTISKNRCCSSGPPSAPRGTICNMATTDRIASALDQFGDDHLVRLRAAADASPNVVPGLLAYLDYVGDWEQHRRRGVDLTMQGQLRRWKTARSTVRSWRSKFSEKRFEATGQDNARRRNFARGVPVNGAIRKTPATQGRSGSTCESRQRVSRTIPICDVYDLTHCRL